MELNLVDNFDPLATIEDDTAGSNLSVLEVVALHPYNREGSVQASNVSEDAYLERT